MAAEVAFAVVKNLQELGVRGSSPKNLLQPPSASHLCPSKSILGCESFFSANAFPLFEINQTIQREMLIYDPRIDGFAEGFAEILIYAKLVPVYIRIF